MTRKNQDLTKIYSLSKEISNKWLSECGEDVNQRASITREETTLAAVGKLILTLHLVFSPRTREVMMMSQSKKNEFLSSGANLQMSPQQK